MASPYFPGGYFPPGYFPGDLAQSGGVRGRLLIAPVVASPAKMAIAPAVQTGGLEIR